MPKYFHGYKDPRKLRARLAKELSPWPFIKNQEDQENLEFKDMSGNISSSASSDTDYSEHSSLSSD